MPLIDIQCASDADHVHEVNRPIADWPSTPPCPTCGSPTTQLLQPRRVSWSLDPIVVYRAPDGSYRYPGDTAGPGATKYDTAGYERIEIRSAQDARRVEGQINAYEGALMRQRQERECEMRERGESARRSDLHASMKSMSNLGRAVAHAAMARSNAVNHRRSTDPGVFIEVLSMDRSNRDAGRRADGKRQRD